jgi:truncated hemoglobin YjbI
MSLFLRDDNPASQFSQVVSQFYLKIASKKETAKIYHNTLKTLYKDLNVTDAASLTLRK